MELNMFEEMRVFAQANPKISAAEILSMATVNGARALGLTGQAGELSKNAFADLIAIPSGGNSSKAAETVVNCPGDVCASMINGQWAIAP